MRIGTFCYAHSRGLGHLAYDFYKHGIITDVLIVEHPKIPVQCDWYPKNTPRVGIRNLDKVIRKEFARHLDVLMVFETPFDWTAFEYCKDMGVKTVLVPMYECTPKTIPEPDLFICPSLLDMQYFPKRSVFVPLPTEVPWKERTCALEYIHNGGYLGLRGREGTTLLIDAMQHVKSPLRLTIRVQEHVVKESQQQAARDNRIDYRHGTVPFDELYATGDVCVAPQKFNGCSLPLQEALASGLLLMSTDRFPMNTWLPMEPLIPVKDYRTASIGGAYRDFQEAQIDPIAIAATMDAWYGKDITDISKMGKAWADQHSWEVLKPRWMEALAQCESARKT